MFLEYPHYVLMLNWLFLGDKAAISDFLKKNLTHE